MKVQATDEALVRTAGHLINEQVKAYSNKFNLNDQQDLLAMVAFDCLIDTLRAKKGASTGAQTLTAQVNTLVQLVDQTLPSTYSRDHAPN